VTWNTLCSVPLYLIVSLFQSYCDFLSHSWTAVLYCSLGHTVCFTYFTSLWVKGEQTHTLCKPNALLTWEMREWATEHCCWEITFIIQTVYASFTCYPFCPTDPLAFYFWQTLSTQVQSNYSTFLIFQDFILFFLCTIIMFVMRLIHFGYLMWEQEYCMTEYLRMSGIYWGLTAIELIGNLERMNKQEILEFIKVCQDDSGGISASIGHDSHLLYTLSAVQVKLHCLLTHMCD
jgi:hypothetical protein